MKPDTPGQESVWDYPRPPRVEVEPTATEETWRILASGISTSIRDRV